MDYLEQAKSSAAYMSRVSGDQYVAMEGILFALIAIAGELHEMNERTRARTEERRAKAKAAWAERKAPRAEHCQRLIREVVPELEIPQQKAIVAAVKERDPGLGLHYVRSHLAAMVEKGALRRCRGRYNRLLYALSD